MKHLQLIALAALLAPMVAASAADKGKDPGQAKVLQDVVACRAIADSTARLACYDRAATALDQAVTADQLVVMDKEAVRETRRSLFGFSLPRIGLFGGSGGDKEEMKQIDTSVTSVSHDIDGRMVFGTAEGATWHQIDDRPTFGVKHGTKVTISVASLGSYFAKFERGVPIRVRRDR
ncbi:type VI secretion protein [Hephaestia mangrovi]|uniref:type VI secretion protein n=1 Tax=Hephaestia mangrovi TaxID=2873268 RepID=UPI001CA65B08|nr:type VI secretion protein [Hephaestia mangrovi]MBY8828087.1 type VI secretion protein [Hephaestia mangrovi]